MKARNLLYITLISLSPLSLVFSQQSEGYIHYEQKVDLQKLRSSSGRSYPSHLPQFRSSYYILNFNQSESVYQRHENPSGEQSSHSYYKPKDHFIYKNHVEKTGVDSKYLLNKQFLISGEYTELEWKITMESKNVGSFYCQKAIFKDSLQNIEAWFTPMIPVMSGPDAYVGLPGLILHVDIDEGKKTITASEIFLENLEAGTIVKPTEGKKISREDFEELQKTKKEELEMNRSGSTKAFKRRG